MQPSLEKKNALFIFNNLDSHIYRLTAAYIHCHVRNIDKTLFFNDSLYFDLRFIT